MTDSTDSIKNNEVKEDDIKKLTEFPSVNTDVLNAIGSESEQIKLSGSKASNQCGVGSCAYMKTSSEHVENVLDNKNETRELNTNKSDFKCPNIPGITINSCDVIRSDPQAAVLDDKTSSSDSTNENVSSNASEPVSDVQVDVVPESMYFVLQQRAQNVLKMISERKYPASTLSPDIGSKDQQISQNQSSNSITNESANINISTSKVKSNESANITTSKVKSNESANITTSKVKSNESANITTSKVKSNESANISTSKVKSNESANITISKVKSNESADITTSKVKSNESADITTSKVKSNESANITTSKVKSNESANITTSKVKSNDSANIITSKVISNESVNIVTSKVKSNESANIITKKISTQSSKEIKERKSLNEPSLLKVANLSPPQDSFSTLSYDNLQKQTASQLLAACDKQSDKKIPSSVSQQSNRSTDRKVPSSVSQQSNRSTDRKVPSSVSQQSNRSTEKKIPFSVSQQSNKSTEQYTTEYSIKTPCVNDLLLTNEASNVNECIKGGNLQKQCSENVSVSPNENLCVKASVNDNVSVKASINENVSVKASINENVYVKASTDAGIDNNKQEINSNKVIKELSNLIDSSEMPAKLSKKGEFICNLFKQKLMVKLESSGNLNESTAQEANITAFKFAVWMEDILKEIDVRKNKSAKETQEMNNNDENKEKEQEVSLLPKESYVKTEATGEHDEDSEVIKMQELTESELIQKYGSYLLRESYDLFEFVGPDNVPVEVRHLTAVISKKVMIVKKKTLDSQWHNWVIEVGPEISLDSVSGNVQPLRKNPETQSHKRKTDAKQWNLKKTDWDDNWKPDIFKEDVKYCRVPLLKKQCMMTEADFDIDYPPYPTKYSQTPGDGTIFEDDFA